MSLNKCELKELEHRVAANLRNAELATKLAGEFIMIDEHQKAFDVIKKAQPFTTFDQDIIITLFKEFPGKISDKDLCQAYLQQLDDGYYFSLAKEFSKFLMNSSLPAKFCMNQYEKLIMQFCYDSELGSKFFKGLRKYQQKHGQENDVAKRRLYQRQLQIPLKDIDLTWDEYQQWETIPDEVSKMEPIYKKTAEAYQKREEFDLLFRQAMKGDSDTNPLEILQYVYQLFDSKELSLAQVINLYEQALATIQAQYFEEAWVYFRGFLQECCPELTQIKYFRRASKVLSKKGTVSQLLLRIIPQGEFDDEYNRLNYLQDNDYDRVQLQKQRIFYHSRRELNNADPVKYRQWFEELLQQCQGITEDRDSQLIDIYRKLAKLEVYLFDDKVKAYEYLDKCLKLDQKNFQNWGVYFTLSLSTKIKNEQARNKSREILKRAVHTLNDTQIITEWIEFETLFGNVNDLYKAEQLLVQLITNQTIEQEEALEAQENISEGEDSVSEESESPIKEVKKPKAKDDLKRKRNQMEQEPEEEPKKEKKVTTEEAKIFVDSDRTIFVRNIPLEISEDDFISFVENRDNLLGCRFVKNLKTDKFKGFAYLDFTNPEEASKAANQLNSKLIGQNKLFAAVSKPPRVAKSEDLTIYISNLSFDITEQYIRDKLAPIQVKEIRLIKEGEDGKARGYGYLDFDSGDYLSQALAYFAQGQIWNGRKVFAEKSDNLSIIKRRQQNQGVIVKNLSFKARESHLRQLFEGLEISQIVIPRDDHNKPRGFALVDFTYQKDFKKALDIQGATILGRPVQIFKSERDIKNGRRVDQKEQKEQAEDLQPKKSNDEFRKFL